MRINPIKIDKIIEHIWYTIAPSLINKQDIWLISDTHFNHKNIQEYTGRPDGWQNLIINNWNNVVGINDCVIHLGDFCFCSKKEAYEIVKSLNGNIFLIKGNHDRHGRNWYGDIGIEVIPKFASSTEDGDILYFTHRMIKEDIFDEINIHGHTHEKTPFMMVKNGGVFVNLSVEKINYTPVRLIDVLRKISKDISEDIDMWEEDFTQPSKTIINSIPVYYSDGIPYISFDDVPECYRKEFGKFMYCSTVPRVSGCKNPIYKWDWVRWCQIKFDSVQAYWY